jgi:predicted small lipoprotein YifL
MKKVISLSVLALMLLSVVGCAQKSESEKLADQMKKAGNEMERDINKALK